MKLLFRLFVSLSLALVVGVGSAWYMINSGSALSKRSFGPWKTWFSAGDPQADPYTRAHFSRSGALPITATSAYYFTAKTDDNNNKLTADCEYLITGSALNYPWWHISVYDIDGQIIANQAQRYAYHKDNIFFKEDGTFDIRLSPTARPGNWIPTSGSEAMQIVLRIFHGKSANYIDSEENYLNLLPTISRIDC